MNSKVVSVHGGEEQQIAHAFHYWKDGSTLLTYIPELVEESELPTPYVVALRSDGWWARNCLVFANHQDEAIERVLSALRYCAKHGYESEYGSEAAHIQEELDRGNIRISVRPYPLERIGKLDWSE